MGKEELKVAAVILVTLIAVAYLNRNFVHLETYVPIR